MTTNSNIQPPVTMIPLTQKGAIVTTNINNRRFPHFLPYGKLTDVTLYDLVKHNIPAVDDPDNIPADYGSGLVTVEERIVKAHTFYCDLDADADWDDSVWNGNWHLEEEYQAALDARDMTGDGSASNPWKNLTFALEKMQCMISNSCGQYFKLVCTGKAHYAAGLRSATNYYFDRFDGDNRFILEGVTIEKNTDNDYSVGSLYYVYLYNCIVKVTSSSSVISIYYDCYYSLFYNCSANANKDTYGIVRGFLNCGYSSFYNCSVDITATATDYIQGYGFDNCGTSIFYNCLAIVSAISSNAMLAYNSRGYHNCSASSLYSCTANVISKGRGQGNTGFNCDNSSLYNCTANVTVTSTSYETNVSGFYCFYSIFYGCGGSVQGFGPHPKKSCLFSSTDCLYYNCTQSGECTGYNGEIYNCCQQIN